QLQNLTQLELRSNGLSALPPEISQLQNLTQLDLSYNGLSALLPEIFQLQNLTQLELRSNGLSALPPEIIRLHDLRELRLKKNPLEKPPLESLDLEDGNGQADITKLRAWFRQAEEGLDYLFEAKLLLVGEGGAGKTSLMRRIKDPDALLPEKDESTRGIEIERWEFDLPTLPGPLQTSRSKKFMVNIWDFGGQQIYHATHQFFLTKRSLYALVADTRRADTDFYDWLNMVELFSEHSPVFIVKNQKDERPVELDEASLRERFPNLEQSFPCNVLQNRGREEVLDFIRYRIQKLPHVGQALPKTWMEVRTALENDSRNYISQREYFDICTRHGFTRREDKLQLSGYLHDLGVCLHFQEDDLLARTVILKPTWGTDAVYKVLDSKTVKGGRFSKADLKEIWRDEQYAEMRGELLRLMMNFKLCYELPEPGQYIAPQLLSKKKPDYDWDSRNNLQLRYAYPRFMPKGLLSRFIVAVHLLIEDKRRRVWRHGAVLGKDDTRAEVLEDTERREIRIRVSGRHQRDLLTAAVYELEKIHQKLHDLEYHQRIPCNCDTCRHAREPHFYLYKVLKRFAAAGQPTIQCQESFQLVEVRGLLDDVIDEQRRPPEFSPVQTPSAQAAESDKRKSFIKPDKSILIATVTKTEALAVLETFSQASAKKSVRRVIEDRTYYDLGVHGGAPVFMVQSEMGIATPGGALLTVSRAVRDLHPQAVIMCGIAFGLQQEKQRLGD
ncbi:MAG: hypothetical protein GY862_10105, partial [Gammaproteobacteria bacterium]|nr:hypothetical protein [Gammaproteobacteria bacterium]